MHKIKLFEANETDVTWRDEISVSNVFSCEGRDQLQEAVKQAKNQRTESAEGAPVAIRGNANTAV